MHSGGKDHLPQSPSDLDTKEGHLDSCERWRVSRGLNTVFLPPPVLSLAHRPSAALPQLPRLAFVLGGLAALACGWWARKDGREARIFRDLRDNGLLPVVPLFEVRGPRTRVDS
jgi:hypothetical protein